MKISIKPGRYVVAVSGGVDSVVLLHVLRTQPGVKLTVAHFDHGIRADSREDRLLVQELARGFGLPFVYAEGGLGEGASEAQARAARYGFLHKVRRAAAADALLTAHHKDDALETAVINIVRGTGRKGLSSLKATYIVKRPLLHVEKSEIIDYARNHGLEWHEDSTNTDAKYLRNHIRHNVLTRLDPIDKLKLHRMIDSAHVLDTEIDQLLELYLRNSGQAGTLGRRDFIQLPHNVAREVMAAWLRQHDIRTFDKKMLERLTHAAKINRVGSRTPINTQFNLRINKDNLALQRT